MAYKFRLEAVRNVRDRLLEAAKMELGRALSGLAKIERELRLLEEHVRQEQQRLASDMEKGILAYEYQTRTQILANLKGLLSKKEREKEKAQKRVAEKRRLLEERYMEKELVERLRAKDYDAYLKEVARKAQAEMDDLVSMRRLQNTALGEMAR